MAGRHGKHASYRNDVCEIVSRLNADDGSVLFTVARLEKWFKTRHDIVAWAWVEHDRDKYTLLDCSNRDELDPELLERYPGLLDDVEDLDESDGTGDETEASPYAMRGKFGEDKPVHIHCVVKFRNAVSYAIVAKQLGLPVGCIQKPTARLRKKLKGYKFEAILAYITHCDEKQQALGKFRYADSDVHTSPGLNYAAAVADYFEARDRVLSSTLSRAEIDLIINDVRDGRLDLHEAERKCGFANYSRNRKHFMAARNEYLLESSPVEHRTNIYIGPASKFAMANADQTGGLGKSSLAKRIALGLVPHEAGVPDTQIYHEVTDKRVAFDMYREQPVIIWSESRAGGFMGVLGREGTLTMLEAHPGTSAYNVKYGNTILVHDYDIVEGIQPWRQFLDGLAGEYMDVHGIKHKAEARTQTYRRFPIVIALAPSYCDIFLNKGVFSGDDTLLLEYQHAAHCEINVANVVRSYSGAALKELLSPIVETVVESVGMLIQMDVAREDEVDAILPADRPVLMLYDGNSGMVVSDQHPHGYYPNDSARNTRLAQAWCDTLANVLNGSIEMKSYEAWEAYDGLLGFVRRDMGTDHSVPAYDWDKWREWRTYVKSDIERLLYGISKSNSGLANDLDVIDVYGDADE